MRVDLLKYAGKKICVAVSGGRDSMALLHYAFTHASQYGIEVSALNCDHSMRGEESERDSAFVKAYCGANGIKLRFFKAEEGKFHDENSARKWRLDCYRRTLEEGADFIATAHHLSDNAETVLFNLARGTSLSGMRGIGDEPSLGLIRPLIACTRREIDDYIAENDIPYVTDSTNATADYTRNKIRLGVLPNLEEAVPGAAEAIFRFSRLAREDEEYFTRLSDGLIYCRGEDNYLIKPCAERVIFRRAAARIIAGKFRRIDYTSEHLDRLFALQGASSGKKFFFLGLAAVKEDAGVAISVEGETCGEVLFSDWLDEKTPLSPFGVARIVRCGGFYSAKGKTEADGQKARGEKALYFDCDKIPQGAVVRTRQKGDKFLKFGGGHVSLSDYFTDKKIPQSLRGRIPLVCDGGEVLIICGVEISEKVKAEESSSNCAAIFCADPHYTG